MLCDFGMTRVITSSMSYKTSSSGGNKGTSRYLAYELVALADKYPIHTKASDVWAFGMTVYVSYAFKSISSIHNFHTLQTNLGATHMSKGLWR